MLPPEAQPVLLGIHEDTNAGAALISSDGTPLGAVAEGRLSRVKYGSGFPRESLSWLAGIAEDAGATRSSEWSNSDPTWSEEFVRVIAGNPYHIIPRLFDGGPPDGARDFRAGLQTAHLAWQQLIHRSSWLRDRLSDFCRARLEERFQRPIEFVEHHVAHAASAYFTGPWPEATVVTCDNMGDGDSAAVFHGRSGRVRRLWSVGAWHSPGQFYGEVASFLGINAMTAGKVTGLAARGQLQPALRLLERRLALSSDGRRFKGPPLRERRSGAATWKRLSELPAEDTAAAAQACLERSILGFIEAAVAETGCGHLAVAGGVFGNVTLNRKIAELPCVEGLWVHPAMSDQGIALGAALHALSATTRLAPRAMEHVYLGPSYQEADIARALDAVGVSYARPNDLTAAVADLLAEGKVVARFDGALEYGPRALGNRSILVRPDDPDINDWLNERLGRSEFMPFAPISLASSSDALYEVNPALRPCLPFMTAAVPVRRPDDSSHAGVVHVDGTARPQLLEASSNPGMYAILEAFEQRTGIPSLVNTSFNLHGEPIVCSPTDALRTFRKGDLDALVLGPYLLVGRSTS